MDPTMSLGPTWEQINALSFLWDALLNWFNDDGERAAVGTPSSYEASPESATLASTASTAPLPVVARSTEAKYGWWMAIPEAIELRYSSLEPLIVEGGLNAVAETDAASKAASSKPAQEKCKPRSIPLEAIEYRYGAYAHEEMYLPICDLK